MESRVERLNEDLSELDDRCYRLKEDEERLESDRLQIKPIEEFVEKKGHEFDRRANSLARERKDIALCIKELRRSLAIIRRMAAAELKAEQKALSGVEKDLDEFEQSKSNDDEQ